MRRVSQRVVRRNEKGTVEDYEIWRMESEGEEGRILLRRSWRWDGGRKEIEQKERNARMGGRRTVLSRMYRKD